MRYFFLAVVMFFPFLSCFSQTEKDSLLNLIKSSKKDTTHVQILIELSIVEGDDFVESKRYGKQAIDLARNLKDEKSILRAYINMLKLYRAARVNDTALHFAAQSHELALKLSDANSIAEINLDAGNVYLNSHNYLKALSEFIAAARILDSLGTNPRSQMTAYANIGNMEIKLGNYEKALDYVNKGLKLAEEIHYEIGVAYSFKTLGMIYRNLKKLDLAESSYKQALESYKKMDNQRMISESFLNLGTVYFDKNDFVSATNQYEQSLTVSKKNSIAYMIPYGYAALGASWNALSNFPKAKAYFDSTLQLTRGVDPYLAKDSYENLAQIAELEGNHKQSLNYFKLYSSLSDSLTALENKSAAEEIEAKYQNAAKQNEIELLRKDRELQQVILKRQQANILIVAIISMSAIIIGILLINRYRLNNRAQRAIELERMRNNIARDLHDDIGSTLSSINIISQLALQEQNGNATHFQRIAQQSSGMMESMSDIVWSINPHNDSMEQVISKMKEFASEILDPLDVSYSFTGEENLVSVSLDASLRKNLFLIFKEAINNAAKYSGANSIRIDFKKQAKMLHLTIADNGKGFDVTNDSSGNGLRNMKERAKNILGSLSIKSSAETGTEVSLVLPIT
jgi:signal transduction histidine kinase/Tfp pilus assembly protein PilF